MMHSTSVLRVSKRAGLGSIAALLAGILLLLLPGCVASRYYPRGSDRAYLVHDLRGDLVVLNGDLAFPVIRPERGFACTEEDLARVTAPLGPDERVPHPLTVDRSHDGPVLDMKVLRIRLHRSSGAGYEWRDLDLFLVRRDKLRTPYATAQNVVHFYNRLLACRDELGAQS